MKKIAFIFPPFLPMPPVKGGAAETLVMYIIDENEKHGSFNITVYSVYDAQAKHTAAAYKNTKFIYADPPKTGKAVEFIHKVLRKLGRPVLDEAAYIKKIAALVSEGGYDEAVCENVPAYMPYLRRVLGNDGKTKLSLHLHNDYCYAGAGTRTERAVGCCDRIINVSDYIKNRVLTICKTDDSVRVLPNCADGALFSCEANAEKAALLRRSFGAGESCCVFIYCGRIIPEKGVAELVRAFKGVSGDVKLIVIGSRWYSGGVSEYTEKVKALAADMEREGKIIFAGYIPHSELPAYYCAADVCVAPSICEEASGLIVDEAMACGLPLIITDSGGMPEKVDERSAIIIKRGAGMEQELAAAMIKLAQNKALRAEMGKRGLELSASRGPERYFKNFERIMNS